MPKLKDENCSQALNMFKYERLWVQDMTLVWSYICILRINVLTHSPNQATISL